MDLIFVLVMMWVIWNYFGGFGVFLLISAIACLWLSHQ